MDKSFLKFKNVNTLEPLILEKRNFLQNNNNNKLINKRTLYTKHSKCL